MKNNKIIPGIVLALLCVLGACQKEISIEAVGSGDGLPASREFTIGLNLGTKTANDGLATNWVAGDKLNVFHAEAGSTAYVNDGAFEIKDVASGQATGILSADLESGKNYDWYVLYPYNEATASPAAVSLTVPTEQVQAATGSMAHICGDLDPLFGSVKGQDAAVMPTVAMNHLLAIVKIRARNYNYSVLNLETVSFSAKSDNGGPDVQLAGSFTVNCTGESPVYTAVSPITRPYVRLTAPAALNTNDYAYAYLAVVPFVINHAGEYTVGMNNTTGGITMALYETQGGLVPFRAGRIKEVRQGTVEEPPFKDGINFYIGYLKDGQYVQDEWNAWRVDLPSQYQLAGEFSFKDLLYSCNIGDASVVGAADGNGGSNVYGRGYDACIVNNGTSNNFYWRRNARFGHNFEDTNFAGEKGTDFKHGLLMNFYAGYRVAGGGKLMWFRMADPLKDLVVTDPNDGNIKGVSCPSLITSVTGWASAPNYAIGGHEPGTSKDIVDDFIEQNAGWSGDANPQFTAAWNALDIKDAAGNTLIYAKEDHHLALSDLLAPYCGHSKGLYWAQTWYNYEPAWQDGGMNEPGVTAAASRGISLTEDGKIVASNSFNPSVDGGYRITSRVSLQTDYHDFTFIGSRWLVMTTYYVGI